MPVSSSVVTSYFQAIMRATPSPAQVAALSTLADTTALTNTLLGSANNSVDPLIRVYQAAFGRVPDSSGLDYWVGVYNAGGNSVASLQAITAGFAGSTEFRNAYDALDNRGYVSALYANVLGRAGDAAGIDYWVGVLGSGVARSTVLREFASSAEFKATTDSLIDSFLSSAAAGTQTYSGSLLSGAGNATGSSYTLTTSVDAVSGSAANDTITGVLGNASGTYNFGDQINGGSGTDTLNLLDADGTAVGIVALDGVENVNVRVLVSGAGNTTELNAADWSGVATLSNASSTDDSALEVSGLSISTDVTLYGEASVSVQYANLTSGTDTATVSLIGAGSARSASTYASANTENGLATIDIDLENGGLVDAVNIQASGTNYVTLEGGADLRTVNVSGSGAVYMSIDDAVTGFNASQFNGTLEVTFASASDVTAVGGAGNDTFRFGTTFNNNDSVNGGGGTDKVAVTLGGFARNLNVTSVEVADVTFNDDAGGTLNSTAATSVSTFNLLGGSAGADAIVAGVLSGATIVLGSGADALDDVNIGVSTGGNTTVSLGTASGKIVLDDFLVSGAATVSLNVNGGTAGAGSADDMIFDGASTVNITSVGGESDWTAQEVSATSASVVNISTNGSAALFLVSALEGASALTTLTLRASGSDAADITLKSVPTATAQFDSISLVGVSGADITVSGTIKFGNGLTAADTGSISMSADSNSVVGTTALDLSVTGAFGLTLNVGAAATGTVQIGDITIGDGTAGTAQASAQSLTISAVNVGAAGLVSIEQLNADGATAGTTVTIGAITVGTSGGFSLFNSGLHATGIDDVDVSSINMTLAVDASASAGAIYTTAGAVGAITIAVAASGSANLGAINASSIGAITLGASGTGSEVDLAGLTAASNIGAISISLFDDADVTIGDIQAGGDVGSIVIGNTKNGTANFGTIGASSIGSITVSGAGFVDFGALSATRVGSIDASQMTSGTFNLDLSAVVNASEVRLGSATNTIISGLGNDVFTLLGGRTAVAGNDTIQFSTATQNTDSVVNFIAGAAASGGDKIGLVVASFSGMPVNGDMVAIGAGATVTVASQSAGTGFTFASNAEIIVLTTAYASTSSMIADLASGSGKMTLSSGTLASGAELLIVWSDGSDSYVSIGTNMSSGGTTMASGSLTVSDTTLAQLVGVSADKLVAANFTFV